MRIESTTETGTPEERKALKNACADMEGVFMNFLLKSMRKTVTKNDLFGSARKEEFFQDMMDSEVCSAATRTQSIGIADMLYKQLSRQLGTDPSDSGGNPAKGGDTLRRAQDGLIGLDAQLGWNGVRPLLDETDTE